MPQSASVRLVTETKLAAELAAALATVNTSPLTNYVTQVASLPNYPLTFPADLSGLASKATLLSVGVTISGRIIVATTSTPAGMQAGDIVIVVP